MAAASSCAARATWRERSDRPIAEQPAWPIKDEASASVKATSARP
jgi:hypothetical protein